MKHTNLTNRIQKGFTLIETLVGLAIFSILAIVISTLMNDTKDSLLLSQKEALQMQGTMTKLNERYQEEPVTSSVNNRLLIDNRIIAPAYKIDKTAGKIYNSFGGAVTITGVNGNGLTWESKLIPIKACDKLAADTNGLSFETVTIGTTKLVYSVTKTSDISAACTAAAKDDVVTILWTRAAST